MNTKIINCFIKKRVKQLLTDTFLIRFYVCSYRGQMTPNGTPYLCHQACCLMDTKPLPGQIHTTYNEWFAISKLSQIWSSWRSTFCDVIPTCKYLSVHSAPKVLITSSLLQSVLFAGSCCLNQYPEWQRRKYQMFIVYAFQSWSLFHYLPSCSYFNRFR